MPQMTKTYRSYNQSQLKVICDQLCDNIESLLEVLEIDTIQPNGKMMVHNFCAYDSILLGNNPYLSLVL